MINGWGLIKTVKQGFLMMDRQTDRQTDRERERETDRQTDRQTDSILASG